MRLQVELDLNSQTIRRSSDDPPERLPPDRVFRCDRCAHCKSLRASPPPPIPRDNSPLSFNRGEFAVILKDAGANKLATINAVRELTSFGLKDAKDFVDAAGHPAVLVQGITKQEAIAIASKFDEIATVDIVIPVDWRTASSEE